MKKIFRHWKIIYAICCLVFTGWMIHVGDIEFDRVNGQYRHLNARLQPDRIKAAALEELTAECFSISRQQLDRVHVDCSTWETAEIETKIKEVAERYYQAKQRGTVKLVLFYLGFVVIFLLVPMLLTYLLIVSAILLYKNIKFVR